MFKVSMEARPGKMPQRDADIWKDLHSGAPRSLSALGDDA